MTLLYEIMVEPVNKDKYTIIIVAKVTLNIKEWGELWRFDKQSPIKII